MHLLKNICKTKLLSQWAYPEATPIRGLIWKRHYTRSSESGIPSGHINSGVLWVLLCFRTGACRHQSLDGEAAGLELSSTAQIRGSGQALPGLNFPLLSCLASFNGDASSTGTSLPIRRVPQGRQRWCLTPFRDLAIWCLLNRSGGRDGQSRQGSALPPTVTGSCHPEPFPCHCPWV